MTNILSTEILVVDKNLQPCKFAPAIEVIPLLYVDKAKALDDDFVQHTFEDWIVFSEMYISQNQNSDRILIRSPNVKLLIPEVIVLVDYVRNIKKLRKLRFSRQNIFKRDNYVCQYCIKKFGKKDLTIDHITPKSKGGPTNWTNITTACFKCNTKKADRTPAEAGMKVANAPIIPTWIDFIDSKRHSSELWAKLL